METIFNNEPLKSYKFPEISYNDIGVIKEGKLYPSYTPRLLFARMLKEIEDDIKAQDKCGEWENWIEVNGSRILSRALFDGKCIKFNHGRGLNIGHNSTIGAAGFGFERDEDGKPHMIPHLGSVDIGAGVSIGNCVCIDRAVLGYTVIGEGTKIDNLVHVGHGAKIGKHVMIVAGTVLGGSCEIGAGTFIGMHASIKNKVKIGEDCTIGAGAVVLKDVPDSSVIIGNPGKPLIKSAV